MIWRDKESQNKAQSQNVGDLDLEMIQENQCFKMVRYLVGGAPRVYVPRFCRGVRRSGVQAIGLSTWRQMDQKRSEKRGGVYCERFGFFAFFSGCAYSSRTLLECFLVEMWFVLGVYLG